MALTYSNIGIFYNYKSDYNKGNTYLKKSIDLQKKLKLKISLSTTLNYHLSCKMIIKNYNFKIKKIDNIIKNKQNINFECNYFLYKLLDDKSFISKAYKQLKDKSKLMDAKTKSMFFSYIIPEKIVEEYNKVFKKQ